MHRAPEGTDSKVAEIRARALAALNNRDLPTALRHFKKAASLQQNNPELWHEFAECHWATYEFNEALQAYEQAFGHVQSIRTCHLAAKKLFALARFEASALWLKCALELAPDDPELLTMLGEVYDRSNNLTAAQDYASRAISLAPLNVKTVRLAAHLDRRLNRLDEARARLQNHLSKHPSPEDWRLRYELAAVLDKIGDYDAAMHQLLKAKEQLRPTAATFVQQASAIQRRQSEVAALVQRSDFEEWQKQSSRTKHQPIAFLCGHPRSGTTLLEQILNSHQQVVSTDETGVLMKEFVEPIIRKPASAHDSLTELQSFTAADLKSGRSAYLRFTEAHLGEPIGSRLLIEKDPSLTPDLPIALRLFPKGRVIFPLRDPRDVCISYFFTLIPLATTSAASLDLRLTVESCAHSLALWQQWKNKLPTALYESRYETLVTDPGRETQNLLKFFDLPWTEELLQFHSRSKAVRTPTYADVGQPIHQKAVGRWKNYKKFLAPHSALLEPHLRAFGYEP
ncbi:MAG TPA: sulfotransferase [Verrucomicrobiae bacterium]